MPRLLGRIPNQFGGRTNAQASVYTNTGVTYDWAIGGIPFLSAVNNERPLVRNRAPFKKDQFDSSAEPGEQSLTGWWLRSQSSFHLGAGVRFVDPAQSESLSNRFEESEGVDIWTPGEVKLLKRTDQFISAGGDCIVHGARDGLTDIALFAEGSVLTRYDGSATTTITWGGTGTILSITDDGSNYYVADNVGVYSGTLAGGTGSKIWDTGSDRVVLGWIKQRLMAAIGDSLYELAGTGPTLPSPTYTHPNADWTWTAWTEGPEAIYASGYAGARSAIIRLGLDAQGVLPTLTAATVAATMPTGETVHAILAYIGSFVGIGTNKGVRIGLLGPNGQIEYGPIIETPEPVLSIVGRDRFLFCGYSNAFSDGGSGLLRVDLGAPVDDSGSRFAYAPDLQAHVTGEVTSVSLLGASSILVMAISGRGGYREDDTELEVSGFLLTSRVRYNTVFGKLFRQLTVRTPPLAGSLGISVIDDIGNEVSIVTLGSGSDPTEDLSLLHPEDQQEHISLRFTLSRNDTDLTTGAELNSYQLKALPGGPRPRQTLLPLLCFDHEKDKFGVKVGFQGWSLERRLAIEAMDSRGDIVLMQDLSQGTSELVTIENVEFIQTTPPGPNNGGWGGVLYVTTRGLS